MSARIEVLYLTYDGLTDPLGQSQVLPYLLGLSPEFDITVISFEKTKAFNRKQKIISDLIKKRIHWIPKSYSKSPPVLSTLYDLLLLRKICKKLMTEKKIVIVHCRSYLTSLIGLWLKRKYNVKFIFDMRGFWADERIEGGIWNIRNPIYKLIYKFFKKNEEKFIRQADHVIVLSEKAKDILALWGRLDDVTVIPCCVDTRLFDPARINETDRENLRNQLGLSKADFVLCYIGSTGTWYKLNEMFDFFNALNNQNERSKFLILTNDSNEQLVSKATLRNVDQDNLIITSADRNNMPLYISIADFTILFIKDSFSKQGSSPTKLAESLSMGVPAIANAYVGDNDTLFQNPRLGVLIEKFNDSQYRVTVKKILEFKKDSDEIRQFALRELSLEQAVTRFDEVYKMVLARKN